MIFAPLLRGFAPTDPLRRRLQQVLQALPEEVQRDFIDDPRFQITSLPQETGLTLCMALPAPDGSGSRCVVLKQRLADCWEPFGLYVIAHELAHAYLHNGPWGEISDREEAADALAAQWGFPRPELDPARAIWR